MGGEKVLVGLISLLEVSFFNLSSSSFLVWTFCSWEASLCLVALAGLGSVFLSFAVLSPNFSSLAFSFSKAFSSLPAVLSFLASSSISLTEPPIASSARVFCGPAVKYWTPAERADLGSRTDSLGTHTRSLFSPFGGANSSIRNRDNLLDGLLLEIKACSGDQLTCTGVFVELCLPKESFMRWMSNGGLLVVLRLERR